MNQRAFIVTVELEPGEDLVAVADDIQGGVEMAGFVVVEVNPWDSPGTTNIPQLPVV